MSSYSGLPDHSSLSSALHRSCAVALFADHRDINESRNMILSREAAKAFFEADVDGNSELSYDEFCTLATNSSTLTDREMLMAHRLRDRDPPIDPIKANNSSLDSKSADFSGRSLHKLESTPKVDAQARDPEKSMVAVVDEDVHAVNSNWSSSSRNSKSPSKARGRSVEFRTADPNPVRVSGLHAPEHLSQ